MCLGESETAAALPCAFVPRRERDGLGERGREMVEDVKAVAGCVYPL